MTIENPEYGQEWMVAKGSYYDIPALDSRITTNKADQRENLNKFMNKISNKLDKFNEEDLVGDNQEEARNILRDAISEEQNASFVVLGMGEEITKGEIYTDNTDCILKYSDIGVIISFDKGKTGVEQMKLLDKFRELVLRNTAKKERNPGNMFQAIKKSLKIFKDFHNIKFRIKGHQYQEYLDQQMFEQFSSRKKQPQLQELTEQEKEIQAKRLDKSRLTKEEKIKKSTEWELEGDQFLADFQLPLQRNGELLIEEAETEISKKVYEVLLTCLGEKNDFNSITLISESREKLNKVLGEIIKKYSPKQWRTLKKSKLIRDSENLFNKEQVSFRA